MCRLQNELWLKERAALEATNAEFHKLLDSKDVHISAMKAESARLEDRLQVCLWKRLLVLIEGACVRGFHAGPLCGREMVVE